MAAKAVCADEDKEKQLRYIENNHSETMKIYGKVVDEIKKTIG